MSKVPHFLWVKLLISDGLEADPRAVLKTHLFTHQAIGKHTSTVAGDLSDILLEGATPQTNGGTRRGNYYKVLEKSI